MLIGLVKDWLIPGSALFLLWTLTLGVILLFRRKKRDIVGRVWLLLIVLLYWTMSLPVTSRWLEAGLGGRFAPLVEAADAGGATTIVVLGGGSQSMRIEEQSLDLLSSQSAFSVLETVRVSRLLGTPLIIASGGRPSPRSQLRSEAEVIRDALVRLGVPADRIVVETASNNTRDQAVMVPAMLRERNIDRWVLVTSRRHMPRSLRLFRAQGTNPVPSPAARESDGVSRAWWPSGDSLQESRWMLREYAAFAYSWMRGWL